MVTCKAVTMNLDMLDNRLFRPAAIRDRVRANIRIAHLIDLFEDR